MPLRLLAQSRADQRRFVDRTAETREVMRGITNGQPVLVLREPGSGRTSLLNVTAWLLRREAGSDSRPCPNECRPVAFPPALSGHSGETLTIHPTWRHR